MRHSFKTGMMALLAGGLIATASAPSMADGMPERPSVLDRALMDIQERYSGTTATPHIADKNGQVEEQVVIQETTVVEEKPLIVPEFTREEPPVVLAPAPEERTVFVQDNTSFLGLSVGLYDSLTNGEMAGALGVEWQPGIKIAGFLQPLFGAMGTHEGTLYGYGGLGVPLKLSDNWMLMPSAALGYYEDGGGIDLGGHLAYRLGTELAYVFENKSRLGLNAHIITNGKSLSSDDRTEVISIVYTMPIGFTGDKTQ